MLGDSSYTALGSSSGDAPAPAPVGSGLDSGGGDEFGDRSFGGNRWPRQETIALLQIRSDMDGVFRDASVKGPLWDEVSRKLGELGYQRSAKKCKEKFENVYKYHKRTKESRTGKADGKTYRFFEQLAALENQPSPIFSPQIPKPVHHPPATTVMTSPPLPSISVPMLLPPPNINNNSNQASFPTATTAIAASNANISSNTVPITTAAASVPSMSGEMMSNSTSSWSSTDVEGEDEETGGNKRKRKWKDFFERLMKEVIGRQEELQRRFLEAVERREQERASREEAWRLQELSRISRERDILAQERSAAAAKDAAVMAFLHKLSSSDSPATAAVIPPPPIINQPRPAPTPAPMPTPAAPMPTPAAPIPVPAPPMPTPAAPIPVLAPPMPTPAPPVADATTALATTMTLATMGASSSRWPKSEVHDLIKLRTSLETKYQENGPKGPLWEEISAEMRRMGYNRSAKRCKEKWENINKYFKKVKESNKRRPEDSKTCPYFSMLDAIYRDRLIRSTSDNINSVPLMVQPEQQWPPPPPALQPLSSAAAAPPEDDDADEEEEEEEEDGEEAAGNNYELVASKPGSVDQ